MVFEQLFAVNDRWLYPPDGYQKEPIPVVGYNLLGEPVRQGFPALTLTWSFMKQQHLTALLAAYDGNDPRVKLTYVDEAVGVETPARRPGRLPVQEGGHRKETGVIVRLAVLCSILLGAVAAPRPAGADQPVPADPVAAALAADPGSEICDPIALSAIGDVPPRGPRPGPDRTACATGEGLLMAAACGEPRDLNEGGRVAECHARIWNLGGDGLVLGPASFRLATTGSFGLRPMLVSIVDTQGPAAPSKVIPGGAPASAYVRFGYPVDAPAGYLFGFLPGDGRSPLTVVHEPGINPDGVWPEPPRGSA